MCLSDWWLEPGDQLERSGKKVDNVELLGDDDEWDDLLDLDNDEDVEYYELNLYSKK